MSQISAKHNISEVGMDAIYKLVERVLPVGNCAPKSRFAAKKVVKSLGLEYVAIHACPNYHMLFRNEHANATNCSECNAPRYFPNSKRPQKVGVFITLIN